MGAIIDPQNVYEVVSCIEIQDNYLWFELLEPRHIQEICLERREPTNTV